MRRIWMALVLCAAMGGCATIDGIGQDISTGARAVQNAF